MSDSFHDIFEKRKFSDFTNLLANKVLQVLPENTEIFAPDNFLCFILEYALFVKSDQGRT